MLNYLVCLGYVMLGLLVLFVWFVVQMKTMDYFDRRLTDNQKYYVTAVFSVAVFIISMFGLFVALPLLLCTESGRC